MSILSKRKIVVVTGPTASGKSDFAVDLALKKNGEIISADSRQIYKGLDIGTGKISLEEMKGIPHHMLDVVEAGEKFSVAEYARLAKPILENIFSRGKTPVICGGTGQYIDALIYDTEIPSVPPNKKLREELEERSADELYAGLLIKDPKRASEIDRHNKVRLVRALEIAHMLGSVPQQREPKLIYDTEFYLMSPTRELLRERITKRLEKRLNQGMVDEVKWVMAKGYNSDTMKRFGLEYEIIGKFLEGGFGEADPTSLESSPSSHKATTGQSAGQVMKQEIITKSMQYAKRQETWNKKYLPFAKIIEIKK